MHSKGLKFFLKYFIGKQLMINCTSQSLYWILKQLDIDSSNKIIELDTTKDNKHWSGQDMIFFNSFWLPWFPSFWWKESLKLDMSSALYWSWMWCLVPMKVLFEFFQNFQRSKIGSITPILMNFWQG